MEEAAHWGNRSGASEETKDRARDLHLLHRRWRAAGEREEERPILYVFFSREENNSRKARISAPERFLGYFAYKPTKETRNNMEVKVIVLYAILFRQNS